MFSANQSEAWKGVGFVFLSAFMYASLPILGKMAFQAGLSPTGALFLRFSFSLVLILLAFLVLGETLTLLQVLGSLLVFTSMFLSVRNAADPQPFDLSLKIRN